MAAVSPVVTMVTSRHAARAFDDLPRHVYAGDPNWVPPFPGEAARTFDPRRNPSLDGVRSARWLLHQGGRPVGRIAAFAPRLRPETGYFGYFECMNDDQGARLLLRAAEAWLAGLGCRTCHGPIDIVPRDRIGLLTEGFDRPPVLFTPYNPAYYLALIRRAGYAGTLHLSAYGWDMATADSRRILTLARRLVGRQAGIDIRSLDPRRLPEEVRLVARMVNITLADAWQFVPIGEREAADLASMLRRVLLPDLALIAEDRGVACGVALAVPDANWWWQRAGGRLWPVGWLRLLALRHRIPQARVMAFGIMPPYRRTGLAVRLIAELIRRGAAAGLRYGELSQVFSQNTDMDRVLVRMGLPVTRRYTVFTRGLRPEGPP